MRREETRRRRKMTEKQVGAKKTAKAQETSYMVFVKPGSAVDAAYGFNLPAENVGSTIKEVIEYGLGLNLGRKAKRITDAIKEEMKGRYGVTANCNAVDTSSPVKKYFTERVVEGVQYKGVDLIVSSQQTGGNRLERITTLYEK